MFFIPLDNQLHFLLLTLLPVCLVFMAVVWDPDDSHRRMSGFVFLAPVILSVFSFLNAPVRREQAEYLLVGAGFLMVVLFTLAELTSRHTIAILVVTLVELLLPLLFLFIDRLVPLSVFSRVAPWLEGCCIVVLCVLLLLSVNRGKKEDGSRLAAGLLMAVGILLFHTTLQAPAPLLSHLLLGSGLLLRTIAYHRSTFGTLHRQLITNETRLARIDAHLQNEVIKRVASLEKSNRALLERARTDSLTGLYGKAAILPHADMLMAKNPHQSLSVIMLDIDHFKGINDKLGHPIGDRCLKGLSGIARASFRANDILGRYGGDEFIFLLPDTPPRIALTVAERFRQNVETGSTPKYTVSVGISTFPQDGDTIKDLIEAADRALYRSKERGRNQVSHVSLDMDTAPPT